MVTGNAPASTAGAAVVALLVSDADDAAEVPVADMVVDVGVGLE